MTHLSAAGVDFLTARVRLAMLTTLRSSGAPISVPVWFDWADGRVSMFCAVNSAKLTRLARDPRASVLVPNDIDESEHWVSFEGEAEVEEQGGFELAERLAERYWDLQDPTRAETLATWRAFADGGFRKIVLTPTKILEYQPDI